VTAPDVTDKAGVQIDALMCVKGSCDISWSHLPRERSSYARSRATSRPAWPSWSRT